MPGAPAARSLPAAGGLELRGAGLSKHFVGFLFFFFFRPLITLLRCLRRVRALKT